MQHGQQSTGSERRLGDTGAFFSLDLHRADPELAATIDREMGHAGALTPHATEDVESKIAALQDAGVKIAQSAHLVGATMREAFSKRAA